MGSTRGEGPSMASLGMKDAEKHKEDSLEEYAQESAPIASATSPPAPLRSIAKLWRFGMLWSVLLSLAVIMESYDTILLNSLYAAPSFQEAFGTRQPSGKYIIPSAWQSSLGSGTNAALILGIIIGAPIVDRFGFRKAMIGGLLFNFAFVFVIFFAKSLPVLLVGNLLCALPWGMFSTTAPAYAVEVVPKELRSYMASYVNLCWVIGHLIGAGVLKASLDYNNEWTYKLPFLLMFFIPVPLAIALLFAPESPYYLAKKGRLDEAEAAMKRLHAADASLDDRALVETIAETNRLETAMKTGGTFAAAFKGVNLRRTEIAVIAWTAPGLVGYVVQFYATFFFTRAGFPPAQAFTLGLANYAIAFVGTVSSWFFQYHFGRRTIFIAGLIGMLPLMLLVGVLDFVKGGAAHWAQAICLMVWYFAYGSSQGPVPYVIASEASAIKLRAKTLAIARSVYYMVLISATTLSPYMLQTWDLKGKAAFPAFGFTALCLIWAIFRLPEMKGRSYEELDLLFAAKVPAHKFKSTVVTEDMKHELEARQSGAAL